MAYQHSQLKQYLTNAALPLVIFSLIALPLILSGYDNGRAYYDQFHFHLPVISGFIKTLDISDYHAATAPGYHIIFALIGKISGENITLFKLVNALMTCVLIGYLSNQLAKQYHHKQVLLLILPMVLSLYILPAGIWLLPDNLAWLGVAWIVFQIDNQPFNNKQLIQLSIVLAAVVFVRQTYLWLAAIIWASALSQLMVNSSNQQQRQTYLYKCLSTTMPAIMVLSALAITWQGLVPPSFASIHHHISPSAPAFFFALFAIYGSFYLPLFFTELKNNSRINIIIAGMVIGFISVIFIDSNYNIKAGRFSGLWNIIKLTPSIDNKSILMIILATIGGGYFAALIQLFKAKTQIIITIGCLAFVCALTVNQFVYERYFSGFIYILLFFTLVETKKHKLESQKEQNDNLVAYIPYLAVIIFSLLNAALLYRSLTSTLYN